MAFDTSATTSASTLKHAMLSDEGEGSGLGEQ